MKRTTEQRWLAILRKWERSGLEAREFCLREGLSYRTFTNNRRKLRRRLFPASEAVPEFVEISPLALSGGSTVKLELGRLTLTYSDCSVNDLCTILKTLGVDLCCQ